MKIFTNKSNITNLAIFTIFAGGALTFANNAPVQNAVINALGSEVKKVIAIDNTYIVNKNFANYTPTIAVQKVEENGDNYFVTYTLNTIDVDNFTWKDIARSKTLTVNKESLVQYKNLASFVQYELKQVINAELDRLVRTQEIQRKIVSQKTTVTDYTGILGLVMDSTTVVEDPYKPEVSTEALVPVPEKPTQNIEPITNLENLNNPTPVENIPPVSNITPTTPTENILPDTSSATTSTTTSTTTNNSPAATTTETTTENASTTPTTETPVTSTPDPTPVPTPEPVPQATPEPEPVVPADNSVTPPAV